MQTSSQDLLGLVLRHTSLDRLQQLQQGISDKTVTECETSNRQITLAPQDKYVLRIQRLRSADASDAATHHPLIDQPC